MASCRFNRQHSCHIKHQLKKNKHKSKDVGDPVPHIFGPTSISNRRAPTRSGALSRFRPAPAARMSFPFSLLYRYKWRGCSPARRFHPSSSQTQVQTPPPRPRKATRGMTSACPPLLLRHWACSTPRSWRLQVDDYDLLLGHEDGRGWEPDDTARVDRLR